MLTKVKANSSFWELILGMKIPNKPSQMGETNNLMMRNIFLSQRPEITIPSGTAMNFQISGIQILRN
jgi:hypothetical protein